MKVLRLEPYQRPLHGGKRKEDPECRDCGCDTGPSNSRRSLSYGRQELGFPQSGNEDPSSAGPYAYADVVSSFLFQRKRGKGDYLPA